MQESCGMRALVYSGWQVSYVSYHHSNGTIIRASNFAPQERFAKTSFFPYERRAALDAAQA